MEQKDFFNLQHVPPLVLKARHLHIGSIEPTLYVAHLRFIFLQEAKLSQETLADQVVKTNEEKYNLTEKIEAANKVYVTYFQCVARLYPCAKFLLGVVVSFSSMAAFHLL